MNPLVDRDYSIQRAIRGIVLQYQAKPAALTMVLQDIQKHFRYLPVEALKHVAREMQLPLAQVFGVATFYRAFSLKPKGRHHICVCTGTACHVRQARVLVNKLETALHIHPGETTPDMEFSLETVNCLGACALGPLLTMDEQFHRNMTCVKVDGMLMKVKSHSETVPSTATTGATA
jgi:NADH-quinone oxidoreductase subunit E